MMRLFRSLCSVLLLLLFPVISSAGDVSAMQVRTVDVSSDIGVFAVSTAGDRIAYGHAGLSVVSLAGDKAEVSFSDRTPLSLAWSQQGAQLAAVFQDGEQTQVVVYADSGEALRSYRIDGRVTCLAWTPAADILALAVQLRTFSFGIPLKAQLVHLDPQGSVRNETLFDTTLKKGTVASLGDELYRLYGFDLSPLGDDIVFTRFYDPPVIRRNLKVFLRHLPSGATRLLMELPTEAGSAVWSADSEQVVFSDGQQRTVRFDPWTLTSVRRWDLPGRFLAHSQAGPLLYIDGQLYQDGRLAAQMADGKAAFSRNGQKLIVAGKRQFSIYSFPEAAQSPLSQEQRQRLLTLRTLRAKELVTLDEYQRTRRELMK